jgi:subtilisin family serine protease
MIDSADPRSRRSRTVSAIAVGAVAALLSFIAAPSPASAVASNARSAWNFKQIRVTSSVQSAGRDGAGVTVAVVDTWVDASNKSEFGNRVLPGADCVGHHGTCTQPVHHDDCGHGTHVAGTVASTNWGVAPGAKILPVRVLSDPDGQHPDECTGSTDDVAAGIRWADSHGARVINLSLAAVKGIGATKSPVTIAVQQAVSHGRVVVFAAGNSDRPVADSYGGHALIVAATGPSGGLASYSQHGAGVSVAAPGGDPRGSTCAGDGSDCVVSTWLGNQYAALAGTSMAAPHVSGLAALLFAQRPSRSEQNVVDTIESTAHPLAGAGSGRIDAASALGVTTTGTPTHKPATHSPAPAHSTAAQARAGSKKPATVSPAPRRSARPHASVSPQSQPLRVLEPTPQSSSKDLPLLPPVAAAVLLVGLSAGLFGVRRRRT